MNLILIVKFIELISKINQILLTSSESCQIIFLAQLLSPQQDSLA